MNIHEKNELLKWAYKHKEVLQNPLAYNFLQTHEEALTDVHFKTRIKWLKQFGWFDHSYYAYQKWKSLEDNYGANIYGNDYSQTPWAGNDACNFFLKSKNYIKHGFK